MLKVALSTFALVFLAELGDKTQLAVFTLAAETTTPWGVLIGASAALLFSTVLAVLLAVAVRHMIPEAWTKWIRVAAGGLFILVGIWTIWLGLASLAYRRWGTPVSWAIEAVRPNSSLALSDARLSSKGFSAACA